jgi:WXXGXW repeat (2 copies)
MRNKEFEGKDMQRFRILIWPLAALLASMVQIISITIAPPALPVYVQPPIPEPGYLWTPGYWAYGPDGYFWVPGTWVRPQAGWYLCFQ